MSSWRDAITRTMMHFENVVVVPTEELMKVHGGPVFVGGPAYPNFNRQVLARHCFGENPRTVDAHPRNYESYGSTMQAAIWCGACHPHFGHMLADYGMRAAQSCHMTSDIPLLFSVDPGTTAPPSQAFWAIMDALKINRSRVHFVGENILVKNLYVFPQAERLEGGRPSEAHLDFMDELSSYIEFDAAFDKVLYVSRSQVGKLGNIAGEAYIDDRITSAGGEVLYPETMSLEQQLRAYKSARALIFAEGSAMHSLQLMGRMTQNILVLPRRAGYRLAEQSLAPRSPLLRYSTAIHQAVRGARVDGKPYNSRGIAILDPATLQKDIKEVTGLDLSTDWDENLFWNATLSDFNQWIARTRARAKIWNVTEANETMIRSTINTFPVGHPVADAYHASLGHAA